MATATTVTTLIDPTERSRVDAATEGYVTTLHARSVKEVMRTVREQTVRAVIVSPAWITHEETRRLGELIREFPDVPTLAMLSRHDADTSERLLQLGTYGVRRLVDVTRREGWSRLRDIVSAVVPPETSRILYHVLGSLREASSDARRLFEFLIVAAPITPNVRALCRELHVEPTTLMSRFSRAGMPSPKRYLSAVRLLYASSMFEVPGYSIADVAYRLSYSSPQSFARHVRCVAGVTAGEFRDRSSFREALSDFTERFILPYRAALRTFHPF